MKKLLEASFRIFNLMVVVILLYIKKKDEMIKKKKNLMLGLNILP